MNTELVWQLLAYVIVYAACHLLYALLKWMWSEPPDTKKDAEAMSNAEDNKPDQTS